VIARAMTIQFLLKPPTVGIGSRLLILTRSLGSSFERETIINELILRQGFFVNALDPDGSWSKMMLSYRLRHPEMKSFEQSCPVCSQLI